MRYSAPAGTPPRIELQGVTKLFPGVVANDDVSLDVRAGEIHALLGENGAGKSTLMNVLTGIYRAERGHVLVDGTRRFFTSPPDAIAAGIGMVHQHFKLVEAFTVAENIHLGWNQTPKRLSKRDIERRTAEVARQHNIDILPLARVCDLSTGERQRVEILRVLSRDARILILDEPTAVLTPQEARALFASLRRFVASGNSVIFISHKLDEVLTLCDRISVLRGGRKVATFNSADTDALALARLMIGRDVAAPKRAAREVLAADRRDRRTNGVIPPRADPVLSLRDVVVMNRADGGTGDRLLNGVTLDLHAGEILGIAGVAGNGQKALTHVLTGMAARQRRAPYLSTDKLWPGGRPTSPMPASGISRKTGSAWVWPRPLSVTDNAVLREYRNPEPRPLVRSRTRRCAGPNDCGCRDRFGAGFFKSDPQSVRWQSATARSTSGNADRAAVCSSPHILHAGWMWALSKR